MKIKHQIKRLVAAGLLAVVAASHAQAQFTGKYSKDPKTRAVEEIVEKYLMAHPEVIQRALAAQQDSEAKAAQAKVTATLSSKKSELFNNPDDMVLGNPQGDVTLVEFFDFRCGFCKRAHTTLDQLLAEDKNVRLVLKQFPILGPDSMAATKAALAAARQGKYKEFHHQVFALDQVNANAMNDIARGLGLDMERFEKDQVDPSLVKSVVDTAALAEALGIQGTPNFVLGNRVISGAMDLNSLKANLTAARTLKPPTSPR